MMLTLIEGAEIFSPTYLGQQDLVVEIPRYTINQVNESH